MDDVTERTPIVPTHILNQRSQSRSSVIAATTAAVAVAAPQHLAVHRASQDPAAIAATVTTRKGAIEATATEAMEVKGPMVLLRGRSTPLTDGVSPNRDRHHSPAQPAVFDPLDQALKAVMPREPREVTLRRNRNPPGASIS